MAMKIKLPYEPPMVVDLGSSEAFAAKPPKPGCATGGSPAEQCTSGTTALGGMCASGSVASAQCSSGSSAQSTDCKAGSMAAAVCAAGSAAGGSCRSGAVVAPKK